MPAFQDVYRDYGAEPTPTSPEDPGCPWSWTNLAITCRAALEDLQTLAAGRQREPQKDEQTALRCRKAAIRQNAALNLEVRDDREESEWFGQLDS
ncbi:hypothetical protein KCU98_g1448, partial [Aureobasidium melanogenum]